MIIVQRLLRCTVHVHVYMVYIHVCTCPCRHRLKKGFHLTRAQSGVVTLATELTARQQSSDLAPDQPMLLQYVIFPFNEATSFASCLTSELWVEPQCGVVTQVPPGLQYILGCTHDQIPDKVGMCVCIVRIILCIHVINVHVH